MVKRINLLLIRLKKQGSECTTPLLKKKFGKHLEIFHEFAEAADKFIKLFSL